MISIIVPVYNVEKYLRECIDSVLAQTYQDWELILVDDGSHDASPSICEEYALKDSRIRTVQKENGGVSSARNKGIEESHDGWVMFLDADDTLTPHALEYCISKSDGVQMVCTELQAVHENGKPYKNSNQHYSEEYIDSTRLVEDILTYRTIGGPVCKLVSKSVIGETRFDETLHKGEDAQFWVSCLLNANFKIFRSSEIIYRYRILPISLSHGNNTKQISYIKELLGVLHNRYEEAEVIEKKLQPAVAYSICFNYEEILSHQGWWKHFSNEELEDFKKYIQRINNQYPLNEPEQIVMAGIYVDMKLSLHFLPLQIKNLIKTLLQK